MSESAECARVRELALELTRDAPGDVPAEVREHADACPRCAPLASGARALADELAAWSAPAAPDDLVARTLARLAVAGAANDARSPRRRRTGVELLTTAPLAGSPAPEAPEPRRLLLRLVIQAAAATVLFAVSAGFAVMYYPAIAEALEEKRVRACQAKLVTLQRAALRYRAERPSAPALRGAELRLALVRGGYVDELVFVCPGHHGEALRERSFFGELPAGSDPLPGGRPMFWDRFGNHGEGFNVVYADGRVETVTVDALASWHRRTSGPAEHHDEDGD